MEILLSKIHRRRHANTTKLAGNTYGSVPWQDDPISPTAYEARVRYYNTDIIKCFYSVDTDAEGKETPVPLVVFIDTDGWNTPQTFRRVNYFFYGNGVRAAIHSYKGEVFLMTQDGYDQAEKDHRAGLFTYPVQARRHYNLFDKETNRGVIFL